MIATTIEQSKRLLELGLSPDTADMWHNIDIVDKFGMSGYMEFPSFEKVSDIDEPCWSLTALLELMPKTMKGIPEKAAYHFVLKKNAYDDWQCNYEHPLFGGLYSFAAQKTPIDATYYMVVWLLENGHIKTEKI